MPKRGGGNPQHGRGPEGPEEGEGAGNEAAKENEGAATAGEGAPEGGENAAAASGAVAAGDEAETGDKAPLAADFADAQELTASAFFVTAVLDQLAAAGIHIRDGDGLRDPAADDLLCITLRGETTTVVTRDGQKILFERVVQ